MGNLRNDERKLMSGARRQSWVISACGAVFLCGLAGCLTVDQMAPPVGPEFSRVNVDGVTLALLERGREIYLQDCTRCHSVEPINRYSQDRWHLIIERMAMQAKMGESQKDALKAYVLAAHRVLTEEVGTE